MEQKLKEFRSRRRREMLLNKPKEFFKGLIGKIYSKGNVSSDDSVSSETLINTSVCEEDEASTLSAASDDVSVLFDTSLTNVLLKLLYFILWIITYLIAVHFEFGVVYLIVSALLFMYFNTRTGPKKKSEVSAYSVFNPGCEPIQGTLKAEHLEKALNLIQH